MAATAGDKVPRPVQEARQKLAGKPINAETIVEALGRAGLNKLAGCARYNMVDSVRDKYNQFKTDQQKREWLAQYVLDPKIAKCTASNETAATDEKLAEEDEGWLYESQIAIKLNDKEMAKILCESGELQDRPADHEALNKAGYKQYWFVSKHFLNRTGTKQTNAVRAEVELSTDEYNEVKEHMASSTGKPVKRKLAKADKDKEDKEAPAKKELRNAAASRNSALRKLKTIIDKATNTMKSHEDKLPRLVEKGYPDEMKNFCASLIQKLKPHTDMAQDAYNAEVIKVPGAEVGAMKAKSLELEKMAADLEHELKEWIKGDGTHTNKIC